MAVKVTDLLGSQLGALRYQPTAKRLRASINGQVVADTCDGLVVWEPGRIVPTYAVPAHAFSSDATSAAYRPDDADLSDYLVLDFAQFDWHEEDEPIVGHPHDPFHRIDILHSSRHVRIDLDGQRLAESTRPVLLFETLLPVRFYLPIDDVTTQMQPSDTVTYCAYKGRASYYSLPNGRSDIAWTYLDPLREAEPIRGHVCFFDEHVDVTVDGFRQSRPITPWSD